MVRRYVKRLALAGAGYAARGVGQFIAGKARSAASTLYNRAKRRFSGKSVRSTRAVTQQHDIRSTYTARRRNGRSFRKFRAKVRAALQADNPRHLYQAVLKSSASTTDSVAGFSGVYFLDLNTTAQGDIFNIFKDAYSVTAADSDNYKVYIKSAQIDFIMKNQHATNACEIDVFECIATRDDSQVGDVNTIWNAYFNDMDAVGTVTSSHPSLTPYQVPNFMRSWKVVKSTKFMVDPGKAISMQMRASLNQVISGVRLAGGMTVLKGVTRMFFFRVRGIPENATPTAPFPGTGLGAWNVAWSAITNISYQSMPTPTPTENIDQSK